MKQETLEKANELQKKINEASTMLDSELLNNGNSIRICIMNLHDEIEIDLTNNNVVERAKGMLAGFLASEKQIAQNELDNL